jgi:hypothetical protein
MILATFIVIVLGLLLLGGLLGVVLYVIAARRAKRNGTTLPRI